MLVLACIFLSWILEKSPSQSPCISYCIEPPELELPTLYLILSFSYSATFRFPTSLPIIPLQRPVCQIIWNHSCSPLLCCKCPALTPPGESSQLPPKTPHLCLFQGMYHSALSDILPPLLACEQPEGQDCGSFANECVCSQAPSVGCSPATRCCTRRGLLGSTRFLFLLILLTASRFFFEEPPSLTQSACGLHGADHPLRGS